MLTEMMLGQCDSPEKISIVEKSRMLSSHFRYLIGQGANVGVVNSEGETPLDIAEEEAMEELLQNEIDQPARYS